jgi:hypothetical protein
MDIRDTIAEEIANGLIGHIAMASVTDYVVNYINKEFDTNFADTSELLEFAQERNMEIEECEMCGWYVDYLDAHEEHTEVVGCEECLRYYEED